MNRQKEARMGTATIQVEQSGHDDPMAFHVTVREGHSQSRHHVTMRQSTYHELTGGKVTAEICIHAAFAFLLCHEPKESILSSFDVTIISRYFPSFGREFAQYI